MDEPALRGPLLSDDTVCFVNRPYREALTAENFTTILDPRGDPGGSGPCSARTRKPSPITS